MTKVLVIIPTFDNGPTLRPAIRSVLQQREHDLEVVVIGDGAPSTTDDLMDEMCDLDRRVRYVRRPKSPRTGEPYRDEVIRAADAAFVLYCSDDDVWMPDHAGTLCEALTDHDLAATLSMWIDDSGLHLSRMDFADPVDRALELVQSRVGITETGHRLDSYLRLPVGWRTTPSGRYTDHWMWCQWLEQSWVRAMTVPNWTMIHLPKTLRTGHAREDRADEQWRWLAEISAPEWERRRPAILSAALLRSRREADRHTEYLEAEVASLASRLADAELGRGEQAARADQALHALSAIETSRTWVLAQRMATLSGWQRIRRMLRT